jgi:hypothetical protein
MVARSSRVVGMLVLAVLLPVVPTAASESVCDLPEEQRPPVSEPAELCGVTTIEGDAAGVLNVTLTRSATIEPEIGVTGGIQIEGSGPFAGVALIEDPPSTQARGFVAAKAATESTGNTFIGFDLLEDCSPCTVPAGKYRLYLLASGGHVSVTLELEGLSGTTSLAPTRPTGFEAQEFTRRVELEDNLVAATAGDTFELSSPGFLYRGIRLVGVDVTGTGVYECTTEPLPGFPPTCVEGNAITGGETWIGERQNPSVIVSGLVPPNRYSQGAWFASPVPPSKVDTLGVWLSFD